MEDLPSGLVAIKDGSLNDRSETSGKLIAWKWEGQPLEHLGRLLVRRHAAIIAEAPWRAQVQGSWPGSHPGIARAYFEPHS